MNIVITARGYKAPERLKSYLNDKLKRIDRFSDQILNFDAVLSYEKLDQVVEFKLRLNHKNIIIKERSDDVFKSIDLAIDSLERKVTKVKGRIKEHSNQKIVESLSE